MQGNITSVLHSNRYLSMPFKPYEYAPYPRALTCPSGETVKDGYGNAIHLKQVIVKNEEEEKAQLAQWAKEFPSKPAAAKAS